MSLTSSLNNAFSGLSATSRHAEIVSNNVSNALVDGYSTKNINVSSLNHGGVRIDGITRSEDSISTVSRRLLDAQVGEASVTFNALERVEKAFGAPGSANALANLAAQFESDLRALSNAPASVPDARSVLSAMQDYAAKFRTMSTENAQIRTQADASIAREVDTLNVSLERIEKLNNSIATGQAGGQDVTGMEDQRAILIDKVASIVPLRSYKRDNGVIALFTPNGGTLIDGRARVFGFTQAAQIAANLTIAGGGLSGLSVDGVDVDVNTGLGQFDGGSLAAHFETRDTTIPTIDARLDGLARDLIERFQDPTVDPTLSATDAGLFTDSGAAFDPLNELGLAGRISVNAAVDPDQGGTLTRLRDGVNAVAPGTSGDNTILRNMLDALVAPVNSTPSLMLPVAMSAPDLAAVLTADITQQSVQAEEQFAYLTGEHALLRTSELDLIAVDTDDQLQKLIAIEQAYTANARVITVVDELMQTILNI